MKTKVIVLFILVATLPRMILCQSQLHLIATMSGDTTGDTFGSSVSGIGDVNGDGYDDVLVGAPVGNYAKLFFGGAVFDTNNYVKLVGEKEQVQSRFGLSVAGGDVNGDGYSDIVISAPYYYIGGQFGIADAGIVYIYFGGQQFDTIPDLTLAVGGWYFKFGRRLSVVDDVNGDGYKDIVIGAPNDDWDAHGRVFIYFGGPTIDNQYDVLLEGEDAFDMFGQAVAGVGDVNKDGYGDILIGAPQHLTQLNIGKAYLVYGGTNISLSNSIVFVGDSGAYGQFGREVAGLGDINGDSYPDFGIMALNKIDIHLGEGKIDSLPNTSIHPNREYWYFSKLFDLNKDGFDDFVAVSDSVKIYFGASFPDTIPKIIFSWAAPVCFLGNINSDQYTDIACASGGWDPKGKVYIYSYGYPDNVDENYTTHPKNLYLSQNCPNPFNPETKIEYEISEQGWVTIKIFDILGREITTLINENKFPGNYTVRWNAVGMPSGVYFYRLITKNGAIQKKMILLR